MSPFAGYDMPIQYSDIATEHRAVRERVGVFDVSHMGEVWVRGAEAETFVNRLFTNDITGAPVGKVFYGMMCYDDGGTVDDLLVYKMGAEDFFLVINAANIDKDWEWICHQEQLLRSERAIAPDALVVENASEHYAQIAVQGPLSEQTLQSVLGIDGTDLTFYTAKALDGDVILSRTGYTGEDGFEIYASAHRIVDAWQRLIEAGIQPCGLGCRDTLRFEVGLPLYGDELSEQISPVMAGLGMFVKIDKQGGFIGRDALARQKAEGTARRLVGLEMNGRAIARHGYTVLAADGTPIGEVTTGYLSVSTDKSVAMALIDSNYATLGTTVQVQIRKKVFEATVVKKRFYDKHYKK